jgi:bifunctional polynucleotide phosphatase/kinase
MQFFENDESIFYHIGITPSKYQTPLKIASFDIDNTIVTTRHALFANLSTDIYILPDRLKILKEYHMNGFIIVFFTNQFCNKSKLIKDKMNRMENLVKLLNIEGIPCMLFAALKKDNNRKPNIGMWKAMKNVIMDKMDKESLIDMDKSFYVGDAAGRIANVFPEFYNTFANMSPVERSDKYCEHADITMIDHSADDSSFAYNVGVNFHTPEDIFIPLSINDVVNNIINLKISTVKKTKNMVIMVGMPGSGKTTIYRNYFAKHGYYHINRDTLKTNDKIFREIKKLGNSGENMIIDNTNPSLDRRKEYYTLAKEYGYTVTLLNLVRSGTGWNKIRSDSTKVPRIAYSMFFCIHDYPENNEARKICFPKGKKLLPPKCPDPVDIDVKIYNLT